MYRYFGSLEALQTAIVPHLRRRVGYPLCGTTAEMPMYVNQLFTGFQTNRALTS